MHPGLTSSQARWNRCCYLGDVVHRCWLWPRAAPGPGPGPVLGVCDLPELVPIWSEYVTEVVPFGVARGCREPTRSLCRVWSRRMRVLRCACLPPLSCVPAVGAERVWSRRVRVLRTGVVLVSRPPARGPFLRGARSGSRGRAPSPEYWLSCFRLTGHCLFSRSETNRVAVCSAEP